jgi:hypothetical protein
MRIWSIAILCLAVAACVPGSDRTGPGQSPLSERAGGNAVPEEQAETPQDVEGRAEPEDMVAAPATATALAVQPEPVPTPEPPLLARQRAACAETGGHLMPRGSGFFACVQPTGDAGRSCDASADCEGLCLARSGTCAPLHPLFGCHDVFTLPGRRETLCTD